MRRLLSRAALTALALLLTSAAAFAQASPPYTNPAEITRHSDGKLQAVMILGDADRNVPGLGVKHLRYFQGYDPTTPNAKAPADLTNFAPGPTLRARVGDKVEIMFLNAIDDSHFQYTFVTANGKDNDPSYGCDATSNLANYPAKDVFPNCFHGSSTANIHFHGTHTNPDALGDNVLEQVMPDKSVSAKEWAPIFKKIFDMPMIPMHWADMPLEYRTRQEKLVKARGNGLWEWDEKQIAQHQWPQYMVGAYPNVFVLPTAQGHTAGQAPGTDWYHAHKHGSTTLHSLNGLAGALIIEGPYDDFLKQFYGLGKSYGNFEKVMVFQLVNPDQNLERPSVNFNGVGPGIGLINGLANPTLTMRPGEVQLWRVINAGNGATFTGIGPGVVGPAFFTPVDANNNPGGFTVKQVARDGVQFSPANYASQPFVNNQYPFSASGPAVPLAQKPNPTGIVLLSGNRADVLIQAPAKAGTYTNGLLTINVTGDPAPAPLNSFPTACTGTDTGASCWPAMPPDFSDLAKQANYPHKVTFGWDAEPGRATGGGVRLSSSAGLKLPPRYTIDNRQFEQFGPTIDQCMPLNALQDWVLENQTTVTHPFHIHINPFQIIKVEAPLVNTAGDGFTYMTYAPQDNFVWSDTVAIPSGVTLSNGQFIPGRVTIRQHFVDFTGTWVLHCHILGHEDRGMMQLVRVVPASQYPSGCQTAIPQHH